MKKFLVILLSFSLLLSTTGVSVVTHYCGIKGKTGISFGIYDTHSCCCKKPMNSSCCRNFVKVLKITADYYKSAQLNLNTFNDFISPATALRNLVFNSQEVSLSQFVIYEPPPLGKLRTVLYCTLLI